ncbi:MAG: NUDIX domain-containing protein [Patescibacteria group bacterium]|nr:NUDIX domain-containing protein [Patescibacteria group bacterium]
MRKTILDKSKYLNLVVSIAAIKDSKVLMVEEAKENIKGLWNFPSGKVEVGEDLITAAKREFLEETGYEIEITNLCSIYHYSWDDMDGITIRFNFLGQINVKANQKDLADDVLSISWKSKEELKILIKEKKVRFAGTTKMIQDIIEGKRISLDYLYTSSGPIK